MSILITTGATLVFGGVMALAPQPSNPPVPLDDVLEVMQAVQPANLKATITKLDDFGTRHTLSDTTSNTRGIGAARRWLRDQLQSIADRSGRDDISVQLMRHTQEPGRRIPDPIEIANPVMIIPGTMPEAKDRMFVVLGHYDSRAGNGMDPDIDAPGANDDGSGTAAVLELARIFASRPCEATTIFLMTAGEEQGLFGATWFVRSAIDEGWDIRGALSNDIVGDPTGPGGRVERHRVRLFSEGIPRNMDQVQVGRLRSMSRENDSLSRQLARYIYEISRTYDTNVKPWLIYRPDRFLRGGDHTPFNENGLAAVRFTEVHENYDRQHQDVRQVDGQRYGDVASFVDEDYLADVTRLNGAALYSLANAPARPENARIIIANLSIDTTLRWDRSPEPDTKGYEIVYRDTTSPTWDHIVDVGDVTEHTIDLSKDNWFFGVRAYDQDGHRSQVSFPKASRK